MSASAHEPLSDAQVRHVAKLARLALDEHEIEQHRTELSSILDHVAMLDRLDLEGVEPMDHPLDMTNRLAPDEVGPALPVEALLTNAPATLDRYLTVPKVLGGDDGGGA